MSLRRAAPRDWRQRTIVAALAGLAVAISVACAPAPRSIEPGELFAAVASEDYATVLATIPSSPLTTSDAVSAASDACVLQRARLLALAGVGDSAAVSAELPAAVEACPDMAALDFVGRLTRSLLEQGAPLDAIEGVVTAGCAAMPEQADNLREYAADYVAREREHWFPCPLGHGRECRWVGFACYPDEPGGKLKCHVRFSHDTPGWSESEERASHER